MDFEIKRMKEALYGGKKKDEDKNEANIEIVEVKDEVEKYYPKITRETLSIYEYAGVLTKLSRYLDSLNDIGKYIDEIEVNQIISPAELAFNLINDGKFDAILDRRYEKVTFSVMKVKQEWKDRLRRYYDTQHEAVRNEILAPYELNAD